MQAPEVQHTSNHASMEKTNCQNVAIFLVLTGLLACYCLSCCGIGLIRMPANSVTISHMVSHRQRHNAMQSALQSAYSHLMFVPFRHM